MIPMEQPSHRKLIAGIGIIAGLFFYVVICLWLAVDVLPQHWLMELIFYPIAGIAWIWPAAWVIRWSAK